MAKALPILFVMAGGLCLSFVLLALWRSLRLLLIPSASTGSAPRAAGRDRLLHEKQELLTAIGDLRLEHELGKVSDGDFAQLDQNYRARARDVLRVLDEQLAPHRPAAKRLIEQSMHGHGSSAASPRSDAAPEVRSDEAGAASATCASCTASNDADALFCKKCGSKLQPGHS